MLDTDIADLLLKCELLEEGAHGERHTVNDGVVGEITEGDGLAVRRHILGNVDRLTEDGIAVLIPEILAVLVLERFQPQSRLVIHEPCAVCTVGLEDGEVQRQNIVKADEARATSFSKPRAEQTTTLSCGNKNLKEVVVKMIPDYDPKKRYKVTGEFDTENRVMYFDMTTAEVSLFRASDK